MALVAATGCQPSEVEIVVKSPPGVTLDRVALYAGAGSAQTQPIAPQGYATPIAHGLSWYDRDAFNELDQVASKGSSVTFTYRRGSETSLAQLVAVGFASATPVAGGVLGSISVTDGQIDRFPIQLESIGDPTAVGGTPLRLQLWPDPDATCVHVEDRRLGTTTMIVTPGDPDCDGLATGDPLECLPDVYMGRRRATLDEVSCIAPETINLGMTACVLAGPMCVDGTPPAGSSCVDANICVPASACSACDLASNHYACVTDVTNAKTGAFTFIECPIEADMSGKICAQPLNGLSPKPPELANRMCVGNPQIIRGATGNWSDKLQVASAQFEVKDLTSSCNFTVAPSGTWPFPMQTIAAMVEGGLDNGRGIAIPIVFELNTTPLCSAAPPQCTLRFGLDSGSDATQACVDAPPMLP